MHLGGIVLAEDLITATSGTFNLAHFAGSWRPDETRARRFAALALVLVSASAVVGAAFSQALFWWERQLISFGELSALPAGALPLRRAGRRAARSAGHSRPGRAALS